MKYLLLFIPVLLFNCGPKTTTPSLASQPSIDYPEALTKVFDAHGGLNDWNKYQTLSYEMGEETQIIDLNDRREKIEGSNFIMGYDGTQMWVTADTSYKGNPKFYKNLIFYFYAMPFVLADPGIVYSDTPDLKYGDTEYPGIRISYKADIGISPEDEYFIHYNPETYQMEWLGYTVTYFSGEKSEKISWIRYDDWQKVGDVTLPASMDWHNTENNLPTTSKKRREFSNVTINTSKSAPQTFAKIDGATIVE